MQHSVEFTHEVEINYFDAVYQSLCTINKKKASYLPQHSKQYDFIAFALTITISLLLPLFESSARQKGIINPVYSDGYF